MPKELVVSNALSERYVLVTGGSRGIGRAIVLRFAEPGTHIALTYRSSEEGARRTAEEALKRGAAEAVVLKMDVADPESVSAAYKELSKRFPRLDVLVNNAGIISWEGIREETLEGWEKVIRVDLTGVFLVTKTFLPLLEKSESAAIVNISSIVGQTAGIAGIAYHAAKAGVIGLTRKLALELAPKIRVNAVAPSLIETDLVKKVLDTPEKRERAASLHPLKRIGRPEDVAEVVYFLASPAASFITGQTIGVNGGRLMC